jgi:hypothetical protein
MGYLNARIVNQRIEKTIGTNGEPTINSNGRKLTEFCCFNEFGTMNNLFEPKISINIRIRPETQNH